MKISRVIAPLTLSVFISQIVSAAPLYWDPGASGPTTGGSSGGTGNWDTSSSLWYDGISSDTAWVNGDDAFFTNTAGTVTLVQNISAGNIYFTNVIGNYLITNLTGAETLTVASTIDTGGGEHTIATPIVNSGTLNINGTGRLHFVVANSLNNVMINQGTLSMENTNLSIGGSATVANGAALEVNGDVTNLLGIDGVDCTLTLNGSGINAGGALRNMSGLNTWLDQIILGTNTTIYANTNTAFLYDGSDAQLPMTDNGGNYNLTILGPFGNVQFVNYGLTIGGSLLIGPGAGCYFSQGSGHSVSYVSSVVSTNGILYSKTDAGLGTAPATLMTTNIILDGGILDGFGANNWTMNANRGVTFTTNGGTIEDTDSGSTWTTASIYDPSNAPVTFNVTGTATIQIATGNNANVMNLGTAALVVNGGNFKLTGGGTAQYTFSNLVLNADTYTFNYDVSGPSSVGLGSVPNAVTVSNIFLTGSPGLHVGHTTTLPAQRGIYVANGTATIEDVTSGGTVTINGPISGPGNMNFPLGKSGSTTAIVLGGNNTYTGTTTVGASCTVTVGGGSTTGTLGTGNTTDSGTLTFNRTGSYTYNGNISGAGVMIKNASGTVTLGGINTYTGTTTIGAGALLINGTNGASAITVNSSGNLGGTGLINGPVTVNASGNLALGSGTLSISNNVSFAGNISVSVNKSLTPSNGMANVSGTLANTGTGKITVTVSGPALVTGDTFQLFNEPVSGGNNMTITGGTGVTWNNNLAVNGTISVASVVAAKPVINSVQIMNGNFIFSGTNGTSGATYYVLSSTNLMLPLGQWTSVLTNTFPSNGQFSITNPVVLGNPQVFYLLQVQ
jgi:autotransporter-associated beta strand protein